MFLLLHATSIDEDKPTWGAIYPPREKGKGVPWLLNSLREIGTEVSYSLYRAYCVGMLKKSVISVFPDITSYAQAWCHIHLCLVSLFLHIISPS